MATTVPLIFDDASKPSDTLESLRNSWTVTMKTGMGPHPKRLYDQMQWEMSGAHAMLLKALISIYKVSKRKFYRA
jgi:hypothetical protein